MYRSKYLKTDNFYIGFLCFLFCIIELIIHPVGNFPLNDEWLYAQMAFDFSELNIIDASRWGYTSMLTHILYGSFFIKIFGLSYNVLHYSTLVWSILGIVFFYRLLNDFIIKDVFHSFLICLLMLANPLYISLSNSFMTDVPFLANIIIGLYFYLKYKSSQKVIFLIASICFFSWAILIRQLGFAFVAGIFISEIIIDRKRILSAILILLSTSLCLFMFEYWLHTKNSNGYTYLFFANNTSFSAESVSFIFCNFAKRWIHYISFSGFVLFPLLIPRLFLFIRNKEFLKRKYTRLVSFILFVPVAWSMQKFPIGNYLYNTGVGPETLLDTYILQTNNSHSFSIIFYLIKAISYIGAFSLILIFVNYMVIFFNYTKVLQFANLPHITIIFSLFFYYSFLAISNPIFDRYIMIFSVLIIPLIVYTDLQELNFKLFLSLTIVLLMFSTFATKDYFLSHETRWTAINFLKYQYKIADEDINGGLEHESKVFYKANNWYDKWKNVPKNKFVICYGGLKGYDKFTWFTYQRFIPYKIDTVFILKDHDRQ